MSFVSFVYSILIISVFCHVVCCPANLFDVILQKKVVQYDIYANAVNGTVQSFSIKDARFIIEYIGYYGWNSA